ncbi:MAG: ADP-glyceromanno-heptose 6-epimerase [Bacteroidales bacterium]|nr:ADP-glyceromanno-heptose 6-epimerase [Bacteroidales bacterium]MDD4684678.1 ADP-glyceromanno-heptose 6-epimerase [Bacteroidales bacterium]
MIVVTGAAGFIGSCMVSKLNKLGRNDIIIVDDFKKKSKKSNYSNLQYAKKIDRNEFISWFEKNARNIEFVYHLGARTDTTESDWKVLLDLNLNYSKNVWRICTFNTIPLVYASSAATYGEGENGYDDNQDVIPNLKPLNLYGQSKQDFDLWVLKQENKPPFWAGLKFFNVYGPNEYHKQRMASVIFHSFNQINEQGFVKLFRSHRPDFKDGKQLRDFIYVKDLISVMAFMFENDMESGVYNLGTGKARSFYDLALATFKAMGKEANIEFIDIPIDIRDKYQYFTEAKMEKLINAGYKEKFHTLEEGVQDYVKNYLMTKLYY